MALVGFSGPENAPLKIIAANSTAKRMLAELSLGEENMNNFVGKNTDEMSLEQSHEIFWSVKKLVPKTY